MQTQEQAVDSSRLPAPPTGGRVPFPKPEKINNRNYWRLRSLRLWDAERNGSRAESGADDEVLLTSKQVCARYGGVSTMCLWRWINTAN